MDRRSMVELSKGKAIPPFTLDENLTFYCPQENLEAFDNPVIADWHSFISESYEPPTAQGRRVMLILPCTKDKPYIMSREHLAINEHLLEAGFEPVSAADVPAGLEESLPAQYDVTVLNNGLLARNGLILHRFVISEPMGLVPYELIYYYRGKMSPVSRYDDPGLFEHRPNTVCPWRDDSSGVKKGNQLRWGDNEKLVYVRVHNRLVHLIAGVLHRLQPGYERIVAYVSPRLTHRSFLTSASEKKEGGLRAARRIGSKAYRLEGVNDIYHGLVTVIPTKEELERVYAALTQRLEAERGSVTPSFVRGHFARGGGGATPLALPETLRVLDEHLVLV
jgi:hypothetical protein